MVGEMTVIIRMEEAITAMKMTEIISLMIIITIILRIIIQDYYQSYYNDYRNSIININWNGFFVQNRLNRWQVDQIMRLNNLYASFTAWDNFYRYNPDRWYYDRFYALERILGPRVLLFSRIIITEA
jgi:hypothetical protein